MKRLLFLALCALPASGLNFSYVQATQTTGTLPASSATFPSNTVAGNAIIVIAMHGVNATTIPTDTQGNTFVNVTYQVFNNLAVYAAKNIAGGGDTVSIGGSPQGIIAIEYNSVSSTYFVCPGASNLLSSTGNGPGGGGTTTFTTASEAMAILAGWVTANGASWSLSTGTFHFTGVDATPFGGGGAFYADEDLANVLTTYSNTALYAGGNNGARIASFLSLTSCSGGAGPAPSTFAIIY